MPNKEEKREYLKNRGWRRTDRTNNGEHIEYWIPTEYLGLSPIPISLNAAFKKQLKNDESRNS